MLIIIKQVRLAATTYQVLGQIGKRASVNQFSSRLLDRFLSLEQDNVIDLI